jgi:hypothetical protein
MLRTLLVLACCHTVNSQLCDTFCNTDVFICDWLCSSIYTQARFEHLTTQLRRSNIHLSTLEESLKSTEFQLDEQTYANTYFVGLLTDRNYTVSQRIKVLETDIQDCKSELVQQTEQLHLQQKQEHEEYIQQEADEEEDARKVKTTIARTTYVFLSLVLAYYFLPC